MGVKIVWNDITREKTEAIITPASRHRRIGRGVDGAIHRAGGPELEKARKGLGVMTPEKAYVTKAFGLERTCGARIVVHTIGPYWEGGLRNEDLVLWGCYLRAFCLAYGEGCRTITTPVISSGHFAMPCDEALDTAYDSAELFTSTHEGVEVKIVVIDSDMYDYACANYPSMCESRFTKKQEREYRMLHSREEKTSFTGDEPSEYFQNVGERVSQKAFQEEIEGTNFNQLFRKFWCEVKDRDAADRLKSGLTKGRDGGLFEPLTNRKALADASGVGEPSIKHFSSAGDLHPSRDVVFALAVAMRLNRRQTEALLARTRFKAAEVDPGRDKIIFDYIESGFGRVEDLNRELRKARFGKLRVKQRTK